MKRWNTKYSEKIENEKIDAFLNDIKVICKKHGLSLSHEDEHGSFEVAKYSERNMDWLLGAADATL